MSGQEWSPDPSQSYKSRAVSTVTEIYRFPLQEVVEIEFRLEFYYNELQGETFHREWMLG